MAILMIFFALPLCIVQFGNASAFHKAAGNTLLDCVLMAVSAAAVVGIVSPLFFRFDTAAAQGSIIAPIYHVLLSFIPTDIITPFASFNSVGVMIIGCMFGFSFLAIGEKSKPLVTAFDRCNLVAVLTNNYFARFAHLYIGVMAAYYTLAGLGSLTANFLWFALIILAACIVLTLAVVGVTCLKLKVNYLRFLKQKMPSFMVTMSGAGIGASFVMFFNEVTDCGVDIGFNGMSSNLGVIFCKPLYSLFFAASGIFAAHLSGCLTPVIAAEVLLLAIVLPAAIPNIQGGASAMLVLMITQLGMPSGITEIFLTINTLLQFIIVPCNILILQCAIVLQAGKHDLLNTEALHAIA